jgi:hypothetical protein
MPVKLISTSLSRPIRNEIYQLLARPTSSTRRIHKQIMKIKVRINARRRRVRVVRSEPYGLAVAVGLIVGRDGDGAANGILGVEEPGKSHFSDVVGDGAFVESVVLGPEVAPGFFVGGLDWADLDAWWGGGHCGCLGLVAGVGLEKGGLDGGKSTVFLLLLRSS